MRFLILTQYYPPETGAPQNRLSDLAARLASLGHEVRVLTALPNYPSGRVLAGYRGRFWMREALRGIEVVRCWLYATRSKRLALRLLSNLSFVCTSAVAGAALLPRTDIVLVESPPIFLGLSGWWLSRLKRAKMVFNVSDLYPETAIALGYLRSRRIQRLLFRYEAWCYSASSLVTGQTLGIVDSIRRRFPGRPVYLMTNGVDLREFVSGDRTAATSGCGCALVGYAGVLGHAQDLLSVLDAARTLLRSSPGTRLAFYGDGPLREDLQKRASELGLTNVFFGGHLSHAEVIECMRSWRAGIVPLVDAALMRGAVPSKMFEAMAAGCPVVLYAPEGEASELLSRAKAGVWVPAGRPADLAEAISELIKDPERCAALGGNGRAFVREHYDRARIAAGFAEAVQRTCVGS